MKTYYIYNLSEFYEILSSNPFGLTSELQPIWFRGHEYNNYYLLPSLYRDFLGSADNDTYSHLNLREMMRFQNFAARTTHSVNSNINSRLEWQEVYQHYLGKTKMMDWTESARTALSFALLPFLDTKRSKDIDEKQKNCTPVVWMLNPQKLNERVYDYFANYSKNTDTIIKKALADIGLTSIDKHMQNELKKNKDLYFMCEYEKKEYDKSIRGILSLCTLDSFRESNMSRMKQLVRTYEFNPFYYLVLRYYSDSLPISISDVDNILPPLAILQPYHSERIRVQRGTFTIFPNYVLQDNAKKVYNAYKYDLRKMECQSFIDDCLIKINILNPVKVAQGLMLSGERKSGLYPDIDEFVNYIEAE